LPEENLKELLSVDINGWLQEANAIEEYYEKYGSRLPQKLKKELENLKKRLKS